MNKIPTIKLNNGKTIPQIGFGTWQLTDKKQLNDALMWSLESGYQHIDTAQIYNNETTIGQFFKSQNYDISKIFLTTKVWVANFSSKEVFKKSVYQSLKRLGVKKVNLILLHWAMSESVSNDAYKWLEEIYEEGLTDSIGISNFNFQRLTSLLKVAKIKPVVNQIQFDLINQQEKLIKLSKENDIAIQGYSLLKPYLGTSPSNNLTKEQKDIVDNIAKKYNKTGPQLILRYAIQKDIIIFPKSKSESRIKANINIFDFTILQEDMDELQKMHQEQKQKMDDVANGEWNYMLEQPLLFDDYFE